MKNHDQLFDKLRVITTLQHFIDRPYLAGYTGPNTNFIMVVKEIVENSLSGAYEISVPPEVVMDIECVDEGTGTYRITAADNGSGIPADKIQIALCKLATTKGLRHRQEMGQIGFGIKGVLGLSTKMQSRPILTISKFIGSDEYQLYVWRLNYLQEKMDVVESSVSRSPPLGRVESAFVRECLRKRGFEHGLLLEFYFTDLNYTKAVDDYLHQIHFAHPASSITVRKPDGSVVSLERVTESLPPLPKEVLPPITGVSVGELLRACGETKDRTVATLLRRRFHGVPPKYIRTISRDQRIRELLSLHPRKLDYQGGEEILNALKRLPVVPYRESVLSLIGEENIRRMVASLYGDRVRFVDVVSRPQRTYGGGAFQVECCLAEISDLPETVVLRYANKSPLLIHRSKCDIHNLITQEINWKQYGIMEETPVLFVAHLTATSLPFYSSAKTSLILPDEIKNEFRLALLELGRRYARRFTRKQIMRQQLERDARLYRSLVALAGEIAALAKKKKVPPVDAMFERIVGKERARRVIENGKSGVRQDS